MYPLLRPFRIVVITRQLHCLNASSILARVRGRLRVGERLYHLLGLLENHSRLKCETKTSLAVKNKDVFKEMKVNCNKCAWEGLTSDTG